MNPHRSLLSPRRIGWMLVGCVVVLALPGWGSGGEEWRCREGWGGR